MIGSDKCSSGGSETGEAESVSSKAAKAYGRKDYAAGFIPTKTDRGPSVPYAFSNNPRPGQWDGRRMSRLRIADYKRFNVTDGEGIRNSIYVSGCPFRCKGCWNASIWDFSAGHPWTKELEDTIIEDLRPSYVEGISFLGGEPMLNTPVLVPLAVRIRKEFGDAKNIWCWTGYTWEELMNPAETADKLQLLGLIDVLVDGRFIAAQKDPRLQFRGSRNQRIIDVPASLKAKSAVLWNGIHDLKWKAPEMSARDRQAGEGKN